MLVGPFAPLIIIVILDMNDRWIHVVISRITIMTTPLIGGQVTSNDTIDLLRPMLNVHESHYERTAEIIMH